MVEQDNQTITVYVTKYALTMGIQKMQVHRSSECPTMVTTLGKYRNHFHGEGKDWHKTEAAAIERAEAMRQGKIKALKKSIEKLAKLNFVDQVIT